MPEDAAQYERHQKRTEGELHIIFLAKVHNQSWKYTKQCRTENHPNSHSV